LEIIAKHCGEPCTHASEEEECEHDPNCALWARHDCNVPDMRNITFGDHILILPLKLILAKTRLFLKIELLAHNLNAPVSEIQPALFISGSIGYYSIGSS
jgi:hypothetical protein